MSAGGPRPPLLESVGAARKMRVGADVRVGGRITVSEPGRALLADATGAIELRFEGPEPEAGVWLEAEGTWSGDRLDAVHLSSGPPPLRPFPTPDGEWLRLHEASGRRARALAARAQVRSTVRRFFDERGFLEVETPMAVPCPGLDLHLDAVEAIGLDGPRWLGTSPEYQMKRLLAGGLPRIVQLQRCFRRGERGALHEPEFTLLEWYRAFAGSEEVMADTEELVEAAALDLLGGAVIPARGAPVDVAAPWERLTVEEAFQRHADVSLQDVLADEDRFFRVLVEQIEPRLGLARPVFLTRYPASMASLARLCPDDPRWADRFEAYVGGVELCNGFGELIDPLEQRSRLVRDRAARSDAGLADYPLDEGFLGSLEEGLPPAGGNALGFDRLVMLLLGAETIGDVMALPQSRV